MKNKFLLLGLLLFTTSCGDGGEVTAPKAITPAVVSPNTPSSTAPADPAAVPTSTQALSPVDKNLDPRVQTASYQKIASALDLYDFKFASKEYDAGGLKTTAIRGENEFSDFPLNTTITYLVNNSGDVGVNKKSVSLMDQTERKTILDIVLRQVLMYGVRINSNRLVEYNQNGLAADPKFGTDIGKNIAIYYYGNESETVVDRSPSQFIQKIDSDYKISTNSAMVEGINTLKANANKGDINQLIMARDKVHVSLLKALYMNVLGKVAEGISANDVKPITQAEFDYLTMKNTIKSSDNTNTYQAERPFFLKERLDRIEYDKFQKALGSGFVEIAVQEMTNAINNIASPIALNNLNLAQLYIDVVNCSYQNKKFTRTPNQTVNTALQGFADAIKAGDKTKATKLRNDINEAFL